MTIKPSQTIYIRGYKLEWSLISCLNGRQTCIAFAHANLYLYIVNLEIYRNIIYLTIMKEPAT